MTALLENYALVMLTRNRPTFLKRLLTFISEFPEFGEIIIADTSDDATKQRNNEVAQAFPGLTIRILDLPPATSIIDAIELAAEQSSAAFLSYCPDDDFVHPDCVSEAVGFLSRNPDYAMCGGRYTLCSSDGMQVLFTLQSNDSCEHDSPLQRVCNLIRNYWPTQFSVQRREAFLDGVRAFRAGATEDVLGEILHGCIVAAHGKIKVLDRVGITHDVSPHPRQSSSFGTYDALFTHYRIDEVGQRFVQTVVDRLRPRDDVNPRRASAKVEQALLDHLGGHSFLFHDAAARVMADVKQPNLSRAQRYAVRTMALHCFADISAKAAHPAQTDGVSTMHAMLLNTTANDGTGRRLRAAIRRTREDLRLATAMVRRASRSARLLGLPYVLRRTRQVVGQMKRSGLWNTAHALLDNGRIRDTFGNFRTALFACTKYDEVLLPPMPTMPHVPMAAPTVPFSARREAIHWYKTLFAHPFKTQYEECKAAALGRIAPPLNAQQRTYCDRLFDAYFVRNLAEELSRLYEPRFEPAAAIVRRTEIRALSSIQRLKLQRVAQLMLGTSGSRGIADMLLSLAVHSDRSNHVSVRAE